VRDTGVGIPGDEIAHLFDRFHRVHGTRARTYEGSGIGLALVNELVKLHGGTITVDSEPDKGTLFTVSIPARASDAAEHPQTSLAPERTELVANPYVAEALRWIPPSSAAETAGRSDRDLAAPASAPRILLADDNADMRDYLGRLLGDRWTVEVVGDGMAALEAAQARPPALLIADVMMPRLDGFELLRALRANTATREIPVMLLSARAGEEASIEGLEAGADDYIVKPFSARELRARVEAQLLRAELRAIHAAHDRRLRDIFRRAPVAIAMLRGPDHVVEFANDEYLRVIGRRPLLGNPVLEALPELAAQGIGDLLDRVYTAGIAYAADSMKLTLNRGANGAPEQAYFNFVYQPMWDAGGRVDGIAVIAVEVTDLARARQDAEAANRAKDHFLAVLGHELRNPLAPILTAVQLLDLKGPKDPALEKLRNTIARQANLLLKIVEDLLDVGRIITGKLRLDKTRVDLNAIVRQSVEAVSPFIQRRHHTLNVVLPETSVYVDADAARITQVLSNLLNNAAKYMRDGGRIDLSVTSDAGMVLITVRDEGVGIAPDMLERVFDRFVQVGAPGTTGTDGLGIGLSVVKTLVELHGGTVVARSEGVGRGSEFAVSLPAAAPARPQSIGA